VTQELSESGERIKLRSNENENFVVSSFFYHNRQRGTQTQWLPKMFLVAAFVSMAVVGTVGL
jgi:hypothetical protein